MNVKHAMMYFLLHYNYEMNLNSGRNVDSSVYVKNNAH